VAGGAIAISGVMLFFIPMLERRKRAQEDLDDVEAKCKRIIAVKQPEDGTKFTLSSEFPSINNTQQHLNGKLSNSVEI